MITLYGYWRSSAAYRVRIGLNLKNLSYQLKPVNLVGGTDGKGEHKEADYQALNPQGLVPALTDGNLTLGQSLAILEYLEERYPTPALLPNDIKDKYLIKQFVLGIACDIHPLNNLRVLRYIKGELKQSEEAKNQWYHHWIHEGFKACETMLNHSNQRYCFSKQQPTLADVFLVPQVYNARRLGCDLTAYPRIVEITDRLNTLAAFKEAAPESQPEANEAP